ncbi:LacI family DNA-binding transcriptional regulator [Glycomyces luteolus]|uniref:LacI family DNA-binding transcriptional regulator n=1 Tax=Glycomyces luteolus TaxID=2670330 RepID=A0A9X3SS91_9ACTN|nr:LacI family DNA-binding transcriptional regulator [Glycomyces luteolus]MDA1360944.1 LacI family DNA-binding transcriptional regulator [Glycomyces luteolus]
MSKRVTILDVAAAAGVSRQTVTRAMNDMGDISEATRLKVLEAAGRLGYRPSRFARNLVNRQKTHAMGLVVASFRNPYYTDIAADMLSVAGERGWQLMMAASEGEPAEAVQLLSSEVDVVVGHFEATPALVKAAGALPLVCLESASDMPGVHSVQIDIESGIVDAVQALRERGVRRFGMVDSGYSVQVRGVYEPTPKREWFEAAVGAELTGVIVGEETISGGGRAFADLMRMHPDTEAVLMFNDLMALGAVQNAHATAIEVPGDVRIIGVDGLALGEAVDPKLTSISLDRHELASKTFDIVEILAKADFAQLDPIHRTVPSMILWRESA